MTANDDLERRIADYYATEAPLRAPDRVLGAALQSIEITPQRRAFFGVPWRFSTMNTNARMAIAAVAVVAVGVVGLSVLRPGQSPGVGGRPSTPSATPSPSATQSPAPSPSAYVPPQLTQTFTSTIHGLSVTYPAGWIAKPATVPWTAPGPMLFEDPAGDFLYDPSRPDHLFLKLASQPLGSSSFDEWATALLAEDGCTSTGSVVVDGAAGVISNGCAMALVSTEDRGYLIRLYLSTDDGDLQAFDAIAWFNEILATVQLPGETATSPSASAP